tara:strand:+ start:3553 stop:4050 length:498 start_codon:yes stop_codon:yes gene_type:complete
MANEEIITGLRNAIDHGDSLQKAVEIMINSGYNALEVKEASKYIGGGSLHMQQPKPEEHLTMPSKKPGFLSKLKPNFSKKPKQQIKAPIQKPQPAPQTQQVQQPMQSLNQQPQQSKPLAKQLQKIKPKGRSHLKEIILVAVLLALIGILTMTIIFRSSILGWFSG